MNGLDYGFSGGNGSSRRINRFNRNSVGRVLRPHMMDESGEGGGTLDLDSATSLLFCFLK